MTSVCLRERYKFMSYKTSPIKRLKRYLENGYKSRCCVENLFHKKMVL